MNTTTTTQRPEEVLDHAIACVQGQLKELVETVLEDEVNFQMAKNKYKKVFKSCQVTLEDVCTSVRKDPNVDKIVFEVMFYLNFSYVKDYPGRSPLIYVKSNKSVLNLLDKIQASVRSHFRCYSTT